MTLKKVSVYIFFITFISLSLSLDTDGSQQFPLPKVSANVNQFFSHKNELYLLSYEPNLIKIYHFNDKKEKWYRLKYICNIFGEENEEKNLTKIVMTNNKRLFIANYGKYRILTINTSIFFLNFRF